MVHVTGGCFDHLFFSICSFKVVDVGPNAHKNRTHETNPHPVGLSWRLNRPFEAYAQNGDFCSEQKLEVCVNPPPRKSLKMSTNSYVNYPPWKINLAPKNDGLQ